MRLGHLEAGASRKSFRPKDSPDDAPPAPGRDAERDFKGEKRSNQTHASATDPGTRLYGKGDGPSSRQCFRGHLLMENRKGLIVDAARPRTTGTVEHDGLPKKENAKMRPTNKAA